MDGLKQLFDQDGAAAMLSLIERVRHLESLESGVSGGGGGITLGIRSVTAADTILFTDWTILADATGGAVTISLPTAAAAYDSDTGQGYYFNIKKIDSSANAVTIDPAGVETIDGNTTLDIIFQYDNCQFQSNGSSWFII